MLKFLSNNNRINLKINKTQKRNLIILFVLIILSLISICFISINEGLYSKTIAKITSISEENTKINAPNGKTEAIKNQDIEAVVMNGIHKGEIIKLSNVTSFSQINDLDLKVNDEVFVLTESDGNDKIISAKILELKRDKYIIYLANIFIILILVIGGVKGFKSLVSVLVNIIIIYLVIYTFSKGYDLMTLSIVASVLFSIISILIVAGISKKSASAIAGTLLGTAASIIIAGIVIKTNNWNGIHFEEMEFLTHPPEEIFFIELMIGTLGGIMDIAISISSAIEELYNSNENISKIDVIKSAREIGKDIMGTMSNTLVFAYLSGSIPIIVFLLRNGSPITYLININLSLEFMRAITGSIGIVLSIPITIITSILILKNPMIGEA